MPTELEELVGFIAHGNPQVRLAANEALVPYSLSQPSVFKTERLKPVKDLKLLSRDHPKIAEHAMTMLVNLSGDREVLECLATDDKFVDIILSKVVNPEEPIANLLAMLLANLSKWDPLASSLLAKKQPPPPQLNSHDLVINQLMDIFVKGFDKKYNKSADFDYLAYLFADLAKHAKVRNHLLARQPYDDEYPLVKLKVFTEHKSDIRRRGVASTIKNVAFEISSHKAFLADDELNILPYVMLPIMGNEEYDEDETMDMLPDLQLLPPDKQRDPDHGIIQTHLETLTLLTTTREGRDLMREVKVYPIIRETHMRVDHEGVKEACDRLVQVLMRDEAPQSKAEEIEEEDEDSQLVEV